MTRRALLKGLSLATLSNTVLAQSAAVLFPPESAAASLKRVSSFAFGGVGYAGRTSPGETSFRILAALPPAEALTRMEDVFTGTPAAKCYALAAIYKLKPARYKQLRSLFLTSAVPIEMMQGCIMNHERPAAIVERIEHGQLEPWLKDIHTA